jgi:hypothetical protein
VSGEMVSATYNPWPMLASIETLFGYDRLAHANGAKTLLATDCPTGRRFYVKSIEIM